MLVLRPFGSTFSNTVTRYAGIDKYLLNNFNINREDINEV